MLARRSRRTLVLALGICLMLLGFIIGVKPAFAAEVPGSWNRASSSHTDISFDALAGGRTAVLHTDSDYAGRAISNVRAVTTAYTRSGLKLWVVDSRDSNMRAPEPDVRNEGLTTFSYNKDLRKMPAGWIMQICVTHVTRVGPDKTACAKNRV